MLAARIEQMRLHMYYNARRELQAGNSTKGSIQALDLREMQAGTLAKRQMKA